MRVETWLLFLLTSTGMSLSPGPNGLLVLTHSALHGTRKAGFTVAGGLLGFTVRIGLCMFGIGALVQTSLVWLTVLKWVGGAYLVWLGIKVWRSPPMSIEPQAASSSGASWSLFQQGLLSGVTNPKALLFFTALLPQFIDPHGALWVQFLVIAATYAFTEFVVEYGLALAADRIRPWLSRVGRKFNKACGGVFVAIGAALPLRP
ncbi:MAG: LysE family transporter [Proteobacteria bacterium]|nr:LysE family transporter [Pseudomonadota bacterium]